MKTLKLRYKYPSFMRTLNPVLMVHEVTELDLPEGVGLDGFENTLRYTILFRKAGSSTWSHKGFISKDIFSDYKTFKRIMDDIISDQAKKYRQYIKDNT